MDVVDGDSLQFGIGPKQVAKELGGGCEDGLVTSYELVAVALAAEDLHVAEDLVVQQAGKVDGGLALKVARHRATSKVEQRDFW